MISIFINNLRIVREFYQEEVSKECNNLGIFLYPFFCVLTIIPITISLYLDNRYL